MRDLAAERTTEAGPAQLLTQSLPPSPADLSTTDALEESANEILQIRELEVAAARIALTPSVTREQAKDLNAIPITRAMGIRQALTIRSMAQIVANGNGIQFFTTAERCTEARNYRLQVWRLP